jgi:soluble lytic murein transglycosylase
MSIARVVLSLMMAVLSNPLWAQPPTELQTHMSAAMELMALAKRAEASKDDALAEKTYGSLLDLNSNLQEYAHYYLGVLLQRQERISEAKTHFQKILDLSPNIKLQFDAKFKLAQILTREKNFSKAKALLATIEKRTRHEVQYPDILAELAKIERGLRNQGPFCKWIKKLYSRYPSYPTTKDWGLNLYENIFEDRKTNCSTSHDDVRTRIKNLQWAGMGHEAQREILELKSSKQADSEEIERLEVIYNLYEGEVSKAIELLLSHYEEQKTNFGYLMTLANAAARSGEMQAAVGSYYQAYKRGGHTKKAKEALYQSAFMSYQFQDYDGAYRRFREFMSVFPNSGLSRDARWHMAWIRYLRGDYDGAYKSLSDIRRAPSRRKRRPASEDRITYWMAMSLLKQKKFEEAKVLFEGLSKDRLLGYYSVASQFRLKKIDLFSPKRLLRGLHAATRRISRFSIGDMAMPADDMVSSPVSEDMESEDTLASTTTLIGEPESIENSEEATNDDSGSIEHPTAVSESADESDEAERKTSFTNPVLIKRFERARDLMILGMNDWAKWDLYDIERKTSNKEYLKTLMVEYEAIENFNRSSSIGHVSFGSQRAEYGIEGVRYLWEYTYPRAFYEYVQKYSGKSQIPQELIWGIMRAESQYKKDIISPVGALGLMQVMPNTGQKISLIMGENKFKPEMLLEPEPAIKIGSRYLERLMKKFDGSIPLVAAGYNAGPHRVKTWLSSFGDLDMDEFIEHIPFLETRNYVKKVISNFYVYNQLYNSKKEILQSLAEPNVVKVSEPISSKEIWEDN